MAVECDVALKPLCGVVRLVSNRATRLEGTHWDRVREQIVTQTRALRNEYGKTRPDALVHVPY